MKKALHKVGSTIVTIILTALLLGIIGGLVLALTLRCGFKTVFILDIGLIIFMIVRCIWKKIKK